MMASYASAATLRATTSASVSRQQPPPEPVGSMPEKDADGAFKTFADACGACKHAATGSCAMYKSCVCYATNSFFGASGVGEVTDKQNYHWACGDEGGSDYKQCFTHDPMYEDAFGDKT